ncbi:uncharacterized protein Dvar_53900 [Desulfosarcina variabilis str. Montpellier]|uniref:hypothetical protein n=1 Tax=Desulfosarcina variabilis TaxID=2300 RepID=UPI003AFB1EA8
MIKKIIFFLIFLFGMANYCSAITINGYTFDSTSAEITNRLMPISEGTEWEYEDSNNNYVILNGGNTERIYGVLCRIVQQDENNGDYIETNWIAQDTAGNVHLFKITTNEGDNYEITSNDQIPNFIITSNPSVGDPSWDYVDKREQNLVVTSINDTFHDYESCVVIKRHRIDSGEDWYHFYKANVGLVGVRTPNEGDLVRINGEECETIESDFGDGFQGWTYSSGVTWESSEGYLKFKDTGPGTGGRIYAPAEYLRNWACFSELSFDYKVIAMNVANAVERSPIVKIVGPGGEADYNLPAASGPADWETITIPLDEASWNIVSGSWNDLIDSVTELTIYLRTTNDASEETGIDNVVLRNTTLEKIRFRDYYPLEVPFNSNFSCDTMDAELVRTKESYPPFIAEEVYNESVYANGEYQDSQYFNYDIEGWLVWYGKLDDDNEFHKSVDTNDPDGPLRLLPEYVTIDRTYPVQFIRQTYNVLDPSESPIESNRIYRLTLRGPKSITVPAGTFEVYELTNEKTDIDSSQTVTEVRYLAKDIGIVKMISDDSQECVLISSSNLESGSTSGGGDGGSDGGGDGGGGGCFINSLVR